MAKEGHGKGNWGNVQDELKQGETVEESPKKQAEVTEEAKPEEKKVEGEGEGEIKEEAEQ